jgi:hypothetical protein
MGQPFPEFHRASLLMGVSLRGRRSPPRKGDGGNYFIVATRGLPIGLHATRRLRAFSTIFWKRRSPSARSCCK